MGTNLFLRPHSLSFTVLSATHFFQKSSFSKPPTLSSLSTSATHTVLTLTQALDPKLSYGPSLYKGTNPLNHQHHQSILISPEEEEESVFDEKAFTRAFNLIALRVPSRDCFALENRLRGHLLNWPRIRNIARVPGDEVEDGLVKLLGESRNSSYGSESKEDFDSLNRRIYGKAEGDGEVLSPVLYRDRLAKTFDSLGFVKFRNLAKLSRPKKKRKKEEKDEGKKRTGKNEFAMVELVEDGEDGKEGEDLTGLLGEEFKGKRWRGSTRLLLLDERFADKGVEELPEAIKALLREDIGQNRALTYELVKCKLTLFYNYWQMNEILEALLPEGMIVPSAFETVGHIAHLNLRDEHVPYRKLIAKVVLDKNKPKIQTVVNKIDSIHNDYRTMQLEVLAGNHSLVTTVIENGIRFQVDLATVYWNSRLATERQRLLNCFSHNDIICDVFSGVGPIAISAAKKVKRVYANDLNPYAVEYLESNSVLNRLERKIKVFNMDGRRFIKAMFMSDKAESITHVVMNLPNDAAEFLDAFRGIFRNKSEDKELKLPVIHVYGFSKAQDPEFDFHQRIRIALTEVAVDVEMHRVRLVAPGKWMLRASFMLPKSVAFSKMVLDL